MTPRILLSLVCLAALAFPLQSSAKAPKFKGSAPEIIRKCGEYAKKESEKIKDAKVRNKTLETLAKECSYANGVQPDGK